MRGERKGWEERWKRGRDEGEGLIRKGRRRGKGNSSVRSRNRGEEEKKEESKEEWK